MFKVLNLCKCLISPRHRKCFDRQCFDCVWSASSKLSTKPKDHYETLNLSRNCTSKEVRDAFITLSKKYHPDKNKGNPKAQEEFVRVSEAYNVLIKSESRREYDFSLKDFSYSSRVYKSGKKDDYYEVHRYDSHFRDPWKDPSFYKNRKFDEEEARNNYYGIKGIRKKSNDQILFWIIVFAGVGILFQITVIRIANMNMRLTRTRQSEENRMYYEAARARAELYGTRERQVEEMNRLMNWEDDKPESYTPDSDLTEEIDANRI